MWKAEVRDYELDFQGIVNNACYFNYFDQARAKFFDSIGIDIQFYARKKINLILLETKISFGAPLIYKDRFSVESSLERVSRLKFRFLQIIHLQENQKIVAESNSLICAVNTQTQRPCLINELENFRMAVE